jgi:hypothetical protein
MSRDALTAEALAMRELPAGVLTATDIGAYAIEATVRHWPVFPLNGKIPAIPNPHPKDSWERQHCKGECGQLGHGVLDATDDVERVAELWGDRYAGCNIGVRLPDSVFALDIDPRHGGDKTLADLEARHGRLPETLATVSGRGDGGCHYFYRRPAGKLSAKRLGPGIDIKTSSGYVVWAPSIHPDTGRPYVRFDRPVVTPSDWLVELVVEKPGGGCAPSGPALILPPQRQDRLFTGPSTADQFTADTSWSDILMPHGWACRDA